jgi:UDP-2,3-diacylglucosamine hydrolase
MKKTYFISDFHLGRDAHLSSRERELQICRWLSFVAPDAAAIYLVGDVFDAYFEYAHVVPKGYVRLLGKLAELTDSGVKIYFFTGNHDMWVFNYFEQELNIPIYRQPIVRGINGSAFFIGHGDGLGPNDTGYKIVKKVFSNRLCQWLFARLHPNFGLGLMAFFSKKSRDAQNHEAETTFLGAENEWLIQYCERKIQALPNLDFFIFGHRHLPIDWQLKNGKTRYINLGEWMFATTYAVFDGQNLEIKTFENPDVVVHSNWKN